MGLLTVREDRCLAVGSVRPVFLALVSAVAPTSVQDACGADPGFFCREVFERTDDRALAELADKALGATLTAIAILLVALLLNRLVGRAIRRGLRTLHSGPVQERLGLLRRRTSGALLQPSEVSVRAEQRMNALTSVLRSIATAVIFTIALFLVIVLSPVVLLAVLIWIALRSRTRRIETRILERQTPSAPPAPYASPARLPGALTRSR